MTDPLAWQKLVNLRPSLPRHTEFQQRDYNGETWYLLHDKAAAKFHRFNQHAYRLLGFMDGRNNLDQILDCASESRLQQTLDEIPTRDDLVQLIQYLYVADLLVCDFPANTKDIFERQSKKKQQRLHQWIKSPYAWKIRLFNPDRLLDKLLPLAKVVSSPAAGVVWLCVVGFALLTALQHWRELSATRLTDIFSPENLLILWLTYPVFKVIHELGHGLFTKAWGGHVHEFGVVIIAGTPFPYVDATAATGFKYKSQRLMVGAAGMAVELFFASIALLLWVDTEPGLFRNILFNIIIIGSVSTLFFNGNPLMRFDGYHILCDAIDQPNLATRAQIHLNYLIKRFGYGVETLVSPAGTDRESIGLTSYAVAAFLYRLLVLLTIVLVVIRHFPWVGVLLGIWLLLFQLLIPLGKHCFYLAASSELAPSRKRALLTITGVIVALCGFLIFAPLPHSTHAEGVLWLPEDARIRALASGRVTRVASRDGATVEKGQPLLHLSNSELMGELLARQAALEEYRARYQQAWTLDRAQVQLYAQDIEAIEAEIEHLQTQVNNLIITSPAAGTFRLTRTHRLEGSFVKQGETIGLILNDDTPRVRVALNQKHVNRLAATQNRIKVQLSSHPGMQVEGRLINQVPGGTFELPSPVLGAAAGGNIPVHSMEQSTRSLEQVFLLDIEIPHSAGERYFGQRAQVVFQHLPEPLASRFLSAARQLIVKLSRGEQ